MSTARLYGRWCSRSDSGDRLAPGCAADEYLTGQRAKLLLERVLDMFEQCDVVVQTSPLPFDIIGLPELALPIGFTPAGVPVGTILGALPYAEDRLLSVAGAYQAAADCICADRRIRPDRRLPCAPRAGRRAARTPVVSGASPFR